jgi:uncharacterized protein YndB with AHSA1/START domain
MVALQEEQTIHILNIVKEIEIAAPVEIAFEAMLAEMGPEAEMPDGTPYPLKLEAWPGGRWFRDLGDNTGHLWGHVQVIKPPKLIEICGPMFMSYAAASHLQYRLTAEGNGTRLKLTHTAFGFIPEDHRTGVNDGWQYKIERIRKLAEQRSK